MGAVKRLAAAGVVCMLICACSSSPSNNQRVVVPGADATIAPDAGGSATAPDGSGSNLSITSVSPPHGPFVGGTTLAIMGTGFDKTSKVKVGGKGIQVGQSKLLSPSKMVVVSPAGKVGPADVEVTTGKYKVVSKGAFSYDPVYLDPASGPTAGGTLVEVYGTGTTFKTGMKLTLGGAAMTDVEVLSATRLRAKTPVGASGLADLAVGTKLTVREAFRYYVSTNPAGGGLGGGPIKGTLTVSVLDANTRAPLSDVKVVVDDALATVFTGKTDAKGVIVFTKKNFAGPINVTAGKDKYESTTVASFDARDVTILLFPIIKPSPGAPPPGKLAGTVRGYVMFGGTTGVGSKDWAIVPEPSSTDEVKRVYVYGSVPAIGAKVPGEVAGATIDYKPGGTATAWPYERDVYPGMRAVYALAGLYNKTTKKFVPHAMGVTRGVVVGPGDIVKKVDVMVNVPLGKQIIVALADVPTTAKMHKVRLCLDFGSDGFGLRADMDAQGLGVTKVFTFKQQPEFNHKGLSDAAYALDVALDGGGTLAKPYPPYVRGTMRSVKPTLGQMVMNKFVGPAKLTDPGSSGTLKNNTLTWTPSGATADLSITLVVDLNSTPVWRIISDGQNYSVKLPDPTTAGLPPWPKGKYLVWAQWMVKLPSYNFNKYTYNHLQSTYWARWSQQQTIFKTP